MKGADGLIVMIVILVILVVVVRNWQSGQVARQDSEDEASGATFIRTYRGGPRETAEAFQRDAAQLKTRGYVATHQIYTPGSYGCGAFLLALILFLILIGILIFIYMLIVKPAGTLVVTYEYQPDERTTTLSDKPRKPLADPSSALASLARMRDAGHITPEEYEAKKAEIMGRM